ncbi:MAG: type II toxin-antitoxin system prevent-host-death family antitoxin [Pseudomonadota bacterium]
MTPIQASQAKTRLAELLRKVEQGESFEITRHGRVVACITPPRDAEAEARRAAVERFRELRKTWPKIDATSEEILEWRHEGHRY